MFATTAFVALAANVENNVLEAKAEKCAYPEEVIGVRVPISVSGFASSAKAIHAEGFWKMSGETPCSVPLPSSVVNRSLTTSTVWVSS